MTALPTSLPSGHLVTADEYQIMLDLLAALSGLSAPSTTASTGTVSVATTETRDAVMGDYVLTVPAAGTLWRYQCFLVGASLNGDTAADHFVLNIRNGGASSPTAASTLIASTRKRINATGGGGQDGIYISDTFVPGVGTQTISAFVLRDAGAGTASFVGQRSLFVSFVSIT